METSQFFFWYKKENQQWIKNQLTKAKRFDLLEQLLGKPRGSNGNQEKKEFSNSRKQESDTGNKPKWLAEKHKQTSSGRKKKKRR